jgi:hypothetical protein
MRTIALILALAACGTDGGSSTPAPIEGTWQVARSVPSQPVDCTPITVGELTVTLVPGTPPGIDIDGAELLEFDQEVTANRAKFVTSELALGQTPANIVHELQVDAAGALTGTAEAHGDGDDLGCTWNIVLAGL